MEGSWHWDRGTVWFPALLSSAAEAPSSLPLSFSLISHLVWVRDWSLLPLASPWGSEAHRIGRSGDSGSAEGKQL